MALWVRASACTISRLAALLRLLLVMLADATAASPPSAEEPSPASFAVMQLNLLARPFTKYNWGGERPHPHDSVRGHLNDVETEHHTQTAARYKLAVNELLQQSPDVVLLQEVEPQFFDAGMNPAAGALLEAFTPYSSFGEGGSPGTAVLVRRGGALTKAAGLQTQRVLGSRLTGGPSKSSVLVPVTVANDDEVISVPMNPGIAVVQEY